MAIPPRWRKVASDLVAHKTRTALVVLSIAVGVFAVAIVLGGRGVLLREFGVDYAASVAPSAEFRTSGFDPALVRRVRARADVRGAEGRATLSVRFSRESMPGSSTAGWGSLDIVGLPSFDSVSVSRIVRDQAVSWPPREGEVLLEGSVQQVARYSVGETITVETDHGKRAELRVAGFVHDINAVPVQFTDALTGFVTLPTLDTLGEGRTLTLLAVSLDPSLSQAAASRIAADIRDRELEPSGVTVYHMSVPRPGSHFLGDIFKAISLLLLAMSVLSLALSGFLVVTTVSAIMAQQVRQVGIMKAVGGRAGQIMRMYLAMVAVFGAAAVVLGMSAGHAVGRLFISYAAGVLNFRIVDWNPPAYVVLTEIAVGLLVPVLAAVVPVRLGSRVSVVRALNATGISPDFGHGLVDRILGLVRGLPRPVALSLRNTFLRKGRLALTLSTLVLASAVVMAVMSARASMLNTVDEISAFWAYDTEVFLSRPTPSADLAREAKRVPGVTAAETWLETNASLKRQDGSENQSLFVLGLPPDSRFVAPRLVSGAWLSAAEKDGVVVNTDVLKDQPQLKVGDTLRLTIRGREADWRIAGVVSGNMHGALIFADGDALAAAAGLDGSATRLLVKTEAHDGDSQQRVADALEKRLGRAGLAVSGTQTATALHTRIASQLGILVTFLVIMASLLAAVGVIGLTGTMTINVLESTREIGVMRSIGASHGAIFGIFITEGVVVSLMAWGAGAVLSWPLSVWLVRALAESMSLPLAYRFSWPGVWIWLGSVVAIAVVASLLPSWRASQVSVRDAIAYE